MGPSQGRSAEFFDFSGRNGVSVLASGILTFTIASPRELGGSGAGHDSEEFFAVRYAACYIGSCAVA